MAKIRDSNNQREDRLALAHGFLVFCCCGSDSMPELMVVGACRAGSSHHKEHEVEPKARS